MGKPTTINPLNFIIMILNGKIIEKEKFVANCKQQIKVYLYILDALEHIREVANKFDGKCFNIRFIRELEARTKHLTTKSAYDGSDIPLFYFSKDGAVNTEVKVTIEDRYCKVGGYVQTNGWTFKVCDGGTVDSSIAYNEDDEKRIRSYMETHEDAINNFDLYTGKMLEEVKAAVDKYNHDCNYLLKASVYVR